ncbi:XRE family transcriptional regulator [Paenibacillus sp. FSL M7-0802]|uniref:XRE family transcriptional regulator n=1 Tax=Paenibacillus sp. FSL M7-0802 TaxID=2921536 RepID=UPI0030F71F5B
MLKVTPRLGEVLKEKGYTSQLSFCNEHGINQRAVNSFDKSVQHKSTTLFTIARALGVNVEELFTIEEIPDEQNES